MLLLKTQTDTETRTKEKSERVNTDEYNYWLAETADTVDSVLRLELLNTRLTAENAGGFGSF